MIGTPGLNLKVTHPSGNAPPKKKVPIHHITKKGNKLFFFPGRGQAPLRLVDTTRPLPRLCPSVHATKRVDSNPSPPEIHVHRRLSRVSILPSLSFPSSPPPVANHCGSNTLLRRPSPPPQPQHCRFILRPGFHDTVRRPSTSNAGPQPNTSPYNAAEPSILCHARNARRHIASTPHPAWTKNGSGTVSLASKL